MKDFQEIDRIKDFLLQNKVSIIKLNHSVDTDAQRFTKFNGYFQLSTDFNYLEIVNKRPCDQPLHILQMNEQHL